MWSNEQKCKLRDSEIKYRKENLKNIYRNANLNPVRSFHDNVKKIEQHYIDYKYTDKELLKRLLKLKNMLENDNDNRDVVMGIFSGSLATATHSILGELIKFNEFANDKIRTLLGNDIQTWKAFKITTNIIFISILSVFIFVIIRFISLSMNVVRRVSPIEDILREKELKIIMDMLEKGY